MLFGLFMPIMFCVITFGMMFVMFFGFYACQFLMEYLAKQMYILPWIGPWGSVIVFFVIGIIMTYRMR